MKYHTTKEGKRMLISDMTDEHLKNTIDFIIKTLKAHQNIIKSEMTEKWNLDLVWSGISIRNLKKNAERKVWEVLEVLPAYIYEATIRGENYTEILQTLHDRKAATSFFNSEDIKLLGYNDDDDDEMPF
jgi:hypothetical protein